MASGLWPLPAYIENITYICTHTISGHEHRYVWIWDHQGLCVLPERDSTVDTYMYTMDSFYKCTYNDDDRDIPLDKAPPLEPLREGVCLGEEVGEDIGEDIDRLRPFDSW